MSVKPTSIRTQVNLPGLCRRFTGHSPLPTAMVEGPRHIVRDGNPAFCSLVERPLEQIVGKEFSELLSQKDPCVMLLDRVFRLRKSESFTEQNSAKAEPIFWSYTLWPVTGPRRVRGVMIQIAEIMEAHVPTAAINEALMLGALRQHELTEASEDLNRRLQIEMGTREKIAADLAEKARLLDLSHDAIIVRDMKGRIRYWNHGAEELYGWSREESLGKVSHYLLQTEFPTPLKLLTEELYRTGRWIGELIHTKRRGGRITVLARKTLVRDAQGRPSAVLENITDITKSKQVEEAQRSLEVMKASNRKLEKEIVRRQAVEVALKSSEKELNLMLGQARQMQVQLRRLSHQILNAQEEERRRISRELHDEIGQILVGINLHLTALMQGTSGTSKVLRREIFRTQQLVKKSVDTVHQFARELRPAVLDDLGLIPALHAFMREFTERTGVRSHLKVSREVEKLPVAKRAVLYRVALEALNNVARHAEANRVTVIIKKRTDCVRMEIQDDGKAFDVKSVMEGRGRGRLGLLGMRERLEMIGGTFLIESSAGKGTAVKVEAPLTPRRKRLLKKIVGTKFKKA